MMKLYEIFYNDMSLGLQSATSTKKAVSLFMDANSNLFKCVGPNDEIVAVELDLE